LFKSGGPERSGGIAAAQLLANNRCNKITLLGFTSRDQYFYGQVGFHYTLLKCELPPNEYEHIAPLNELYEMACFSYCKLKYLNDQKNTQTKRAISPKSQSKYYNRKHIIENLIH